MLSTGRRPVVDVALQGAGISAVDHVDRAKVLQRLRLGVLVFRHLTRAAALVVLVILGGIGPIPVRTGKRREDDIVRNRQVIHRNQVEVVNDLHDVIADR